MWGFLALGVALRLAHYFDDRSLWSDEAALALNVIGRSFGELVDPLTHEQAAPYGFLVVLRALMLAFGSSEYVFRATALAAGIGSLLLFVPLARRLLTPRAVVLAVAIFSVTRPLVRYSVEVKPYSLDVFVAMALLLALLSALRALDDGRLTTRFGLGLGLAGAVSVWFSFPVVFVLAGAGITMFVRCVRRSELGALRGLALPGLMWAASFAVFYFVALRAAADNDFLHSFWANDPPRQGAPERGAFMPFPPTSVTDLRWFPHSLLGVFADPVGFQLRGLAAFAFLAGCIGFRAGRTTLALLLSPLLLTLLASAVELYPFNGRLLLFAAPALILLIAAGADSIARACEANSTRRVGGEAGARLLAAGFVGLLMLNPCLSALRDLRSPEPRKEMREVLEYVVGVRDTADVIYVYHSAKPQLDYYAPQFELTAEDLVHGVRSVGDWTKYREDLERLARSVVKEQPNSTAGSGRAWVLFSHEHEGEREFFLTVLNELGDEVDHAVRVGADAYLYRF